MVCLSILNPEGAECWGYISPSAKPPSEFLAQTDPNADPTPNPAYGKWTAKDQQVLSYLFSSLSPEIFTQLSTNTTAATLWAAIQGQHASQSRARVISTCMALATATKGSSSVAEYYTKMKGLADEMASAGRKLDDEELVSYILTGLDIDYESVVTVVAARVETITVPELYAQLAAHEQWVALHDATSQSSANMADRGGRGGGSHTNSRGRGGRGGSERGPKVGRGNGTKGRGRNFEAGVFCQVCGLEGHPAYRCWNRYDSNYNGPPQKTAAAATSSSYGVVTNWYMDTGATDHITGDLEKLTIRDRYNGNEQVHAASMGICHVGHSFLQSPYSQIHLKNILHVPQTNKSLVSVHRLARDNNAFLEFHPNHFFLKEQGTKRTLLQGRSEGGPYPLKVPTNKQALGAIKPSSSLWHARLGHHRLLLFNKFYPTTIFLLFPIQIIVQFVMRVNGARVISYRTLSQLAFLPNFLS